MDDGNGLNYMRWRYYSPADGRFTSADPLQFSLEGPYTYALNSPIRFNDPLGLFFGWGDEGEQSQENEAQQQKKNQTPEEKFEERFNKGSTYINAASDAANNAVPISDAHNAAANTAQAFITDLPGTTAAGGMETASTGVGTGMTIVNGAQTAATGVVLAAGQHEQLGAILDLPELNGGGGGDTLDGGVGSDRLLGGAGGDLLLSRDVVADLLSGGGGQDQAQADSALDILLDATVESLWPS